MESALYVVIVTQFNSDGTVVDVVEITDCTFSEAIDLAEFYVSPSQRVEIAPQ